MNSSRFSLRSLITWFTAFLFIVSLPLVAFIYESNKGIERPKGYEVFLMGGTAILGGGLLEWLTWLGNPIALFALYYFRRASKSDTPSAIRLKAKKRSLWMATIAMSLALSFRCWKEVLKSESGSTGRILSFEWGYYFWAAAMVVLCLGINCYFLYSRYTRRW